MTDRERILNLLWDSGRDYEEYIDLQHEMGMPAYEDFESWLADDIIADGWIRLPCKVGTYAKYKYNGAEAIWKITSISLYAEGQPQISLTHSKVTNTVTLSFFEDRFEIIPKEEAEAKLKECEGK